MLISAAFLALVFQSGVPAFRDDGSRQIVERARRARLTQDSTLQSYEATGRQRLTISAGVGAGAKRTAYRAESVFQIRWRDGAGAELDLTGARVGSAMLPTSEDRALEAALLNPDMSPIPYSPGYEALWPARGQTDDRIRHPLAAGAESYYTYAVGEKTRIRLPDRREVIVHELKVRPRSPESNLAIGSLWFDDATGQLVRAHYLSRHRSR